MMLFVGLGSITAANTNLLTNEDNVFVVGFNSEFPPFGYKDDDGNYTGFDIELAKEVAKRNNWTFVPEPLPSWDTKDTELNSEIVECIWSELTINGRENDYTWSNPYINNKQVFVVKSDSNINSLADLKGKNVEVQKGSSVSSALKGDNKTLADTFGRIVEVADYNSAILDLKVGHCDAVILDSGVAQYQVNNGNHSGLKIINETVLSEQYGIGFKLGNTQLKDQVQKTLDEMYADGTVSKIAENYSSYGVPDSLIHK